MKIEFDTRDYVQAHWHEPRGRGSWVFFLDRKMDVLDRDRSFWTPGGVTFTEAKKLAREWVRTKFGDDAADGVLYVGP